MSDDPEMVCRECGRPMTIDANGVSNHYDADSEDIDYDADADHVAILDSDDADPFCPF